MRFVERGMTTLAWVIRNATWTQAKKVRPRSDAATDGDRWGA